MNRGVVPILGLVHGPARPRGLRSSAERPECRLRSERGGQRCGSGARRLCEYDAVPGSQARAPTKPRDERVSRGQPHRPHSALGIGCWRFRRQARDGDARTERTLVYFSEPAEKMCGSSRTRRSWLLRRSRRRFQLSSAFVSGAHERMFGYDQLVLEPHHTFECENLKPGRARRRRLGGACACDRAPGAIDAVCLMYTNSKMMKESMLPHSGSWTLNEFIPIAGQAAADNIAPAIGQIQYSMRAPTLAMCEAAFNVLDRNADHIAAMTHCTVEKAWITRTRAGLANRAIAEITFRNLRTRPRNGRREKVCARAEIVGPWAVRATI